MEADLHLFFITSGHCSRIRLVPEELNDSNYINNLRERKHDPNCGHAGLIYYGENEKNKVYLVGRVEDHSRYHFS